MVQEHVVSGMDEEKHRRVVASISRALRDLVMRTPGVYSIAGMANPDQRNSKREGKSRVTKGVRVVVKDNQIRVSLHVTIDFGRPIPEIARLIQHQAKALIERDFPTYTLLAVNIAVNSVHFNTESFAYRDDAIRALTAPEVVRGQPLYRESGIKVGVQTTDETA